MGVGAIDWVGGGGGKDRGTEGEGEGERCEEGEETGGRGREEGEDKRSVVMKFERRYRLGWRISQACISGRYGHKFVNMGQEGL